MSLCVLSLSATTSEEPETSETVNHRDHHSEPINPVQSTEDEHKDPEQEVSEHDVSQHEVPERSEQPGALLSYLSKLIHREQDNHNGMSGQLIHKEIIPNEPANVKDPSETVNEPKRNHELEHEPEERSYFLHEMGRELDKRKHHGLEYEPEDAGKEREGEEGEETPQDVAEENKSKHFDGTVRQKPNHEKVQSNEIKIGRNHEVSSNEDFVRFQRSRLSGKHTSEFHKHPSLSFKHFRRFSRDQGNNIPLSDDGNEHPNANWNNHKLISKHYEFAKPHAPSSEEDWNVEGIEGMPHIRRKQRRASLALSPSKENSWNEEYLEDKSEEKRNHLLHGMEYNGAKRGHHEDHWNGKPASKFYNHPSLAFRRFSRFARNQEFKRLFEEHEKNLVRRSDDDFDYDELYSSKRAKLARTPSDDKVYSQPSLAFKHFSRFARNQEFNTPFSEHDEPENFNSMKRYDDYFDYGNLYPSKRAFPELRHSTLESNFKRNRVRRSLETVEHGNPKRQSWYELPEDATEEGEKREHHQFVEGEKREVQSQEENRESEDERFHGLPHDISTNEKGQQHPSEDNDMSKELHHLVEEYKHEHESPSNTIDQMKELVQETSKEKKSDEFMQMPYYLEQEENKRNNKENGGNTEEVQAPLAVHLDHKDAKHVWNKLLESLPGHLDDKEEGLHDDLKLNEEKQLSNAKDKAASLTADILYEHHHRGNEDEKRLSNVEVEGQDMSDKNNEIQRLNYLESSHQRAQRTQFQLHARDESQESEEKRNYLQHGWEHEEKRNHNRIEESNEKRSHFLHQMKREPEKLNYPNEDESGEKRSYFLDQKKTEHQEKQNYPTEDESDIKRSWFLHQKKSEHQEKQNYLNEDEDESAEKRSYFLHQKKSEHHEKQNYPEEEKSDEERSYFLHQLKREPGKKLNYPNEDESSEKRSHFLHQKKSEHQEKQTYPTEDESGEKRSWFLHQKKSEHQEKQNYLNEDQDESGEKRSYFLHQLKRDPEEQLNYPNEDESNEKRSYFLHQKKNEHHERKNYPEEDQSDEKRSYSLHQLKREPEEKLYLNEDKSSGKRSYFLHQKKSEDQEKQNYPTEDESSEKRSYFLHQKKSERNYHHGMENDSEKRSHPPEFENELKDENNEKQNHFLHATYESNEKRYHPYIFKTVGSPHEKRSWFRHEQDKRDSREKELASEEKRGHGREHEQEDKRNYEIEDEPVEKGNHIAEMKHESEEKRYHPFAFKPKDESDKRTWFLQESQAKRNHGSTHEPINEKRNHDYEEELESEKRNHLENHDSSEEKNYQLYGWQHDEKNQNGKEHDSDEKRMHLHAMEHEQEEKKSHLHTIKHEPDEKRNHLHKMERELGEKRNHLQESDEERNHLHEMDHEREEKRNHPRAEDESEENRNYRLHGMEHEEFEKRTYQSHGTEHEENRNHHERRESDVKRNHGSLEEVEEEEKRMEEMANEDAPDLNDDNGIYDVKPLTSEEVAGFKEALQQENELQQPESEESEGIGKDKKSLYRYLPDNFRQTE